MKGSTLAAFAMSLGLFASIAGTQTASATVLGPVGASTKATSQASVTKVRWLGYGRWGRWGGGWGRGYWRPGYGWVPFAVAGAVVAGAAAGAYAYGPGPYYYGAPPPPYPYYGPRPYYGPDYGPGNGPVK